MTLSDVLTVLTDLRDAEIPTTKKTTATLVAALTEKALDPLQEWVGDLSSALEEAASSADELSEADAEDREDYFGTLVGDVETVLELMAQARPVT